MCTRTSFPASCLTGDFPVHSRVLRRPSYQGACAGSSPSLSRITTLPSSHQLGLRFELSVVPKYTSLPRHLSLKHYRRTSQPNGDRIRSPPSRCRRPCAALPASPLVLAVVSLPSISRSCGCRQSQSLLHLTQAARLLTLTLLCDTDPPG